MRCVFCNQEKPKRRQRYCSVRCIKSAWRRRNLGKHNATNTEWRKRNPNYMSEYHRTHYVYIGHHATPTSFRKGMIPWNKGRIYPTTPIKVYIRQSQKYREWRVAIFTRDRFRCRWCWRKGGWNKETKTRVFLCVDHITSLAQVMFEENITTITGIESCERLWDMENARTLCTDCHKKTKTYGVNLKFYEATISNR